MKSTLKSAILACFVCSILGAQTTVSQVSGFVRDATGAAITGADGA